MSCDGFADRHPESHGHGIPDQFADPLDTEVSGRFYELIRLGERLEDRTLPQRKTSVLLRVAEATVAEAEELRRDGWRWLVPLHATVNTRIVLAALFFMAIGAKLARPVAPCAAGLRGANAPQISR